MARDPRVQRRPAGRGNCLLDRHPGQLVAEGELPGLASQHAGLLAVIDRRVMGPADRPQQGEVDPARNDGGGLDD